MNNTFTHKGIIGSIDYIRDYKGNIKVVDIHTELNGEGECYKDDWECGDVIYISEYSAIDFSNRKNNGVEFEDIAWTKDKWVDYVWDEFSFKGVWDREYAEYMARRIFNVVEWEDLSTRLSKWLNDCDLEKEYIDWKKNKLSVYDNR